MFIKVIVLFLVFMCALAMFGKLDFPGRRQLEAARCKTCKRLKFGKNRCQCRDIDKGA